MVCICEHLVPSIGSRAVPRAISLPECLLAQLEDAVSEVRQDGALADQQIDIHRHARHDLHGEPVAHELGAIGAH
jgi:hypothetical protein